MAFETENKIVDSVKSKEMDFDSKLKSKFESIAQSDEEEIKRIYGSVKQWNEEYGRSVDEIENMNDNEARKQQDAFFDAHVSAFEEENKNFILNIAEISDVKKSQCCNCLWNFNSLVSLYKRKILEENWSPKDLKSRKLTILLALDDIDKYRCSHLEDSDDSSIVSKSQSPLNEM